MFSLPMQPQPDDIVSNREVARVGGQVRLSISIVPNMVSTWCRTPNIKYRRIDSLKRIFMLPVILLQLLFITTWV